jgi:serine/threonine-protein kinase
MRIRTYDFDAWLPERIAVMKLQGFARDIGGEVVLSAPGHIRLQMLDEQFLPQNAPPKLLSWLGLVQQPPPAATRVLAIIDLYLVSKPTQGRQMIGITVQLTPPPDHDPGERWKPYCDRVFCELRAYLVGYQ